MRRLAFQAKEEAVLAKRNEREQHKLDLLKSGVRHFIFNKSV